MELLTDAERAVLLRGLYELMITRSGFDNDPDRDLVPLYAMVGPEMIDALVRKLGGDPSAARFGAEDLGRSTGVWMTPEEEFDWWDSLTTEERDARLRGKSVEGLREPPRLNDRLE